MSGLAVPYRCVQNEHGNPHIIFVLVINGYTVPGITVIYYWENVNEDNYSKLHADVTSGCFSLPGVSHSCRK